MITAILYNRDDSLRFLADNPGAQQLLPLTPGAAIDIQDIGLPILSAHELHCTTGHQLDVLCYEQLEEQLEKRLKSIPLTESGKQVLIDSCLNAYVLASRIETTLKTTKCWVILCDKQWKTSSDRNFVHQVLLERFLQTYNTADIIQEFGKTPFWLRLLLTRFNIRFLKQIAHTRPVFFNAFTRGFARLSAEITQIDPALFQISVNPLNANTDSLTYIKTWIQWAKAGTLINPQQVTLTIPPRRLRKKAALVHQILNEVSIPSARMALDILRPWIVGNVEWVESIIPIYSRYFKIANARAVFTWDHADRLNTALAESAKNSGVPSLLACHTSVSPGYDDITKRAKRRRTMQLNASKLADLVLVQSPYAFYALRESAPDMAYKEVHPFMWGDSNFKKNKEQSSQNKKIILHASNYFEWNAYLPWAYETSNDYVANLILLVNAVSQIPDAQLIIRMKSNFQRKGEFCSETLKKLLPNVDCYEIREDGSFYDDLAESMLVVSFHSTTIEEAILARRPVLLLGGNARYLHFPARKKLPNHLDRSAIYAPESEKELPEMIRAILSAHENKALSDEEVKDHIWLHKQADNMKDMANDLICNY